MPSTLDGDSTLTSQPAKVNHLQRFTFLDRESGEDNFTRCCRDPCNSCCTTMARAFPGGSGSLVNGRFRESSKRRCPNYVVNPWPSSALDGQMRESTHAVRPREHAFPRNGAHPLYDDR